MRRQVSVAARKFPRLKNEVLTFMLQQAHAKQSKAAHRSKMRPGNRYNRMFSAGLITASAHKGRFSGRGRQRCGKGSKLGRRASACVQKCEQLSVDVF
jgi:hypothetical protein